MNMSIQSALPSSEDDFMIREIVLTHNPDDRQIDSESLLQLAENTFSSAAENVDDSQIDPIDMSNIELAELDEPISLIIHKISKEILGLCFLNENIHYKTLVLLEIFSHYKWDAKVVLALAAFAQSFGLFHLISKLQSDNALAGSLATIKQLSKAILLKPKLKALNSLIRTMMKVTKIIISFEALHLQHEFLYDKAVDTAKSKTYVATYWIFRSVLECSSQISDLTNSRLQQVCSDETVISACSLHSLGMKLNNLCSDLKQHVDICHHQIDTRLSGKLLNMFREKHAVNQEVLSILFGFQLECPLKMSSSQGKYFSLKEMKNKIVILLISKPELLPIDKLFWLLHFTYNHPQHKKLEKSYAVLWVPLSDKWGPPDKTNFEFLSNCLPWFSIRKPWSLSPLIVNFIKQEWKFKQDPMMVVLNENGLVTNSNAMDMVWIWGPNAFPFSSSKEKELREQGSWTLDLLIGGINPLLSEWVKEGRNLSIFGSENLDWIRDFTAKMKKTGIQLEVTYVGCKNPDKSVKNIIDVLDQENLCTSLTFTKVQLFWFRLECIKRSITHQRSCGCDKVANEVSELIDFSENKKDWAIIGNGSSTDLIILEAQEIEKCFDVFPIWCKNVEAYGLVGAVKNALEPEVTGGTCRHEEVFHYEEGMIGKRMVCSLCRRPMETFVMYKCDVKNGKISDSIRS